MQETSRRSKTQRTNRNFGGMEVQSKGTSRTDESGEIKKQEIENFHILYTNADSLMNKRHELLIRLSTLKVKPHIIAITEVKNKTKENFNSAELNIKGYYMFTNDLQTCSRGVIIYVQNSLKAKQLDYDLPFQESVTVEIKAHNCTLTICNIYRSPNSSQENNICLNAFIENLVVKSSDKVLLVGDFNFCDIDWANGIAKNSSSNTFLELLRENFLTQNVTLPTRARGADAPHSRVETGNSPKVILYKQIIVQSSRVVYED